MIYLQQKVCVCVCVCVSPYVFWGMWCVCVFYLGEREKT
jgi:hypothetical protein